MQNEDFLRISTFYYMVLGKEYFINGNYARAIERYANTIRNSSFWLGYFL